MVRRFVVVILEGKDRNFGTTKLGLLRFCGLWKPLSLRKKNHFLSKKQLPPQIILNDVFGYQILIECVIALKTNMQSVPLRINHYQLTGFPLDLENLEK